MTITVKAKTSIHSPVPFLISIYLFISLFMLLLDMDKKVDLREFISTLMNRTNEKGKGVVLKHDGDPVAIVLSYDDYIFLSGNQIK